MEQLGLPPETMRRRVEETLDLLGIADLRDRDLRTLSGGQQQRVAIGSVLTMHPRLLVLDEPTSALDPTAAEDVLATLTRLVHDLGVSVLLAEHRLERVVPFADRICLLTRDGRAAGRGAAPRCSPTRPSHRPSSSSAALPGWSPAAAHGAGRPAPAGTLALTRAAARPHPTPQPPDVVVSPASRSCTAGPWRCATCRSTLSPGRVTALMGRNGSGKSSLLWALQGSGPRASGHASRVGGADPADLKPADRRRLVGLLPQRPSDLLYLETVDEECAAGGAGRPRRSCDDPRRPASPATSTRATCPRASGWRWRCRWCSPRAVRSCCWTSRPAASTTAAKRVLAEILRRLAAEGRAVLVVTHDVEFAAQAADEVVVLAEGEVVSSGPVRRVVAESPAFAPQVTKVLGPPWLRVDEVVRRARDGDRGERRRRRSRLPPLRA